MALTFHLYVLRRFAQTVLVVLVGILAIVFLADFAEAIRRLGDEEGFTWLTAIRFSLLRSLFWHDDILPFGFLWGAIIGLLGLSRRSELVVARASGVSVWGVLATPVLFALAFGTASVLVLNPFVISLKQEADIIGDELRKRDPFNARAGIWIRQTGADATSIMHARSARGDAMQLTGVTAFLFEGDESGFRQKIDAEGAEYDDGAWIMRNAVVTSADADRDTFGVYVLSTNLSASEVQAMLTQPDAVSLWALPQFIAAAGDSGLKTAPFHHAMHELLARPLLLAAMVLVAAAVSLKASRAGHLGRRVLTGITSGFLLYVLAEFLRDLAGNGIVEPAVAAWAPSIAALTIGATVLLYQEDG